MKGKAKIFICHASEDKDKAIEVYNHLRKSGLNPWMDKVNLLPGQNWQIEIPKALKNSDFVVICFSAKAIGKRGYVQREFRLALDILNEIPEEQIFIIPLRLEDCKIPERFMHLQYCDIFVEDGLKRLSESILLHHTGKADRPELLGVVAANNNTVRNNTEAFHLKKPYYFQLIGRLAEKKKHALMFLLGLGLYFISYFLPVIDEYNGFDAFKTVAIEELPKSNILDVFIYLFYNLSNFSFLLIVIFFFSRHSIKILYILPFAGTISALYWVVWTLAGNPNAVFDLKIGYWIWLMSISLVSYLFFLKLRDTSKLRQLTGAL